MIFLQSALKHLQTATFFESSGDSLRRKGFFPTKDPSLLHNCKQYFWVRPDASVLQAVYFNPLEDSFREELILKHYVQHLVKDSRSEGIGFNILSRDRPWDFRVGFSSGITQNVEITAITDREGFFQRLTAEELIQRHAHYPTIRLGILEKILGKFPDHNIADLIADKRQSGFSKSDEVENPYYPEKPKVFTSINMLPLLNLKDELQKAILEKQRKKHRGKQQTILIIDNRTAIADIDDFMRVAKEMSHFFDWVEFPEIWLYTGYGGGHVEEFEECLLLPLKLPRALHKQFGLCD